jgi:hypothetical protein
MPVIDTPSSAGKAPVTAVLRSFVEAVSPSAVELGSVGAGGRRVVSVSALEAYMRKLWLVQLCACVAIMGVCAVSAHAQDDIWVSPNDDTCDFFFTSGSGESNFDWCLTSNGNITKLESTGNREQIMVGSISEGYAVCSALGMSGRDYADVAQIVGFAPTTNLGCTSSGCTFQRDTIDGRFRLLMAIRQNKKEKEINITTTVTNLTASPLGAVTVIRYADADVRGDSGDDTADRSFRAVWARDGDDALVLAGTTFSSATPVFARVDDGVGPAGGCLQPDIGSIPIGPTDVGLVVGYSLGTLGAGNKRTVKFQYRTE